MAPEEQTCPAAWQASGSAETEPSSDLEATHLTLSLWRDPPHPSVKSLVLVSTNAGQSLSPEAATFPLPWRVTGGQ